MRSIARRDFLAASAALGAGMMVAGHASAAEYKTKLKKAMVGTPVEKWGELKEAGFDGVEPTMWNLTTEAAEKIRKKADALDLKIHSVLFGWANFNDPKAFDADVANVTKALATSQTFGASALLVVPCRTGAGPMPKFDEFEIEFDEKTGYVKSVVAGDNSKYAAYIKAQNEATDASRKAVEKLIPVAEKTGVVIALENVWNNLWVKPKFFANFVRSFNSPWVRAYFDIGNHVRYAPPQEWIEALGDLTVKLHVKDFKLKKGHAAGGDFIHPRDGSVNWPAVRKAIEKVGYNGYLSIEDGGLSFKEFSDRLDLIIAGK